MKRNTCAAMVVTAVLVGLAGCVATVECGSWAFNGTPGSNPSSFPLSSAFTFTPANCGKNCDCTKDVMIQMVKVFDIDTGAPVYPTSSYADRATSDGWVIDRVDGEGYGYYSLINDGKTFFSGWNTPGANGTVNTLFDDPSGWGPNTWFFSVDAAVCFSSKTCNNSILGYYFWSWTIDSSGNAATFILGTAWKDLDTEFQNALAAWNTWAPSSGTEGGSSFASDGTSLPHAVKFPTLTDL